VETEEKELTSFTASFTVVVAVWEEPAALEEALAALEPQQGARDEVLVVGNFCPPAFLKKFPRMRWLEEPPGTLVPHLWARGISTASGDWVALTTAHFVPEANWLERFRECSGGDGVAGIGGFISPPLGLGLEAWATWFLRYSATLHFRRSQSVDELAADNAAYRRHDLCTHAAVMHDGFWEPDFHRLVLAEGKELIFDPQVRVAQRASFGIRRFCRQRRHHGRQFGEARMRGKSRFLRLASPLALPIIPLLYLAKVGRRVLAHGRHLGPFLASLPVLALFVTAWALGEVEGSWRAR
jgi:hypothetical protein